jgi:type I restriction enzyme M protein
MWLFYFHNHKRAWGVIHHMFEQTFKNIDDILHKDAGATSELDYTEQTSWILFLKYLDALEQTKAMEAELEGKAYNFIVDAAYRWPTWAAPKTADGKFDHNNALTGDDLKDFVNLKLFPYLKGFKQRATGPNTIEYKIGEIFGEINNKIQSGYNLREVIERIDELSFNTQAEKHELSHLYEAKIKNMGNAGRNGGEYYTPRPLIRAMIQVTNPKIGETIYDGAVGSAGFLCEAFDYLRNQANLSTSDLNTLQTSTFYGKEKKSLAYVIAIMNMILHGIEAPNIIHTNTLAENISDIQEKDRFEIILANPPFGGKERAEVQQNFPIKTGETAFLFLQHFIKSLKAGGRAAVVIKNTFLSNTDNASVSLRKLLLESCNLHTVLDCPGGTFQGAGVKTVVLFFEKGAPTRNTWYYQLDPGRNMGKTNPLNDADLAEFVALQKTFADSPKSWSVNTYTLTEAEGFDLSVKNPNGNEEVAHRNPQAIIEEITKLDVESAEVLAGIKALL